MSKNSISPSALTLSGPQSPNDKGDSEGETSGDGEGEEEGAEHEASEGEGDDGSDEEEEGDEDNAENATDLAISEDSDESYQARQVSSRKRLLGKSLLLPLRSFAVLT